MSDQPTADIDFDDPFQRLELVRSIWREVLDAEYVDDHSTFFDQGGDSLRLVILVERMNQSTGRSLKVIDLFRAGTVAGHAELLAGSAGTSAATIGGTSRDRLRQAARTPSNDPAPTIG